MKGIKKYTFITVIAALLVLDCDALKCQQQVCLECSSEKANSPSREVTCDVRNIVSETWLGERVQAPDPPSDPIEFACIKMTSSNENIVGDSTDVIKGCTIWIGAKYMCKLLVGVELARGKKATRCDYCYKDNCNGSAMKHLFMPLFMVTAMILKFNCF
ncbi:uncharacterized protein LOC143916450 [Arctopsyche grandis]|uniref:uncharacterized protein LOC143916450 n=1 Tax=Arctopsyche grandis TaxID=121162 RepID=UPI00406D658C